MIIKLIRRNLQFVVQNNLIIDIDINIYNLKRAIMWAILGYLTVIILAYTSYKNIESTDQPQISQTMGMLQLKFNETIKGNIFATCIQRNFYPIIPDQHFTVKTKFLINQQWDNNFQVITFERNPNLNCHQYLYIISQKQFFANNRLQLESIRQIQKVVEPFNHQIITQDENKNGILSDFFVVYVKSISDVEIPIVGLNFSNRSFLIKLLNPIIYLSILSIIGIIIIIIYKESINEGLQNVFKQIGLNLLIELTIILLTLFKSQNLCRFETIILMNILTLILLLKKNQIAVSWIIAFTLLFIGFIFLGTYIQIIYISLMGLMLCSISKANFNIRLFSALILFSLAYIKLNPLFIHDFSLKIHTYFWVIQSLTPFFIQFMGFMSSKKKQSVTLFNQDESNHRLKGFSQI